MLKYTTNIIAAVLLAVAAFALVVADLMFGWSRQPIAAKGDSAAFAQAAQQQIETQSAGNAVFVLIEDGEPVARFATSKGKPVDEETQFQVASLSKWISAWGVMTLVEKGVVDLDAPVSTYLSRWSLPESEFDNNGVTARRLLSHMAGLDDGLGYAGFAPGEEIQSLEQSLTRASDASPGKSGVVRVGIEPGTEFAYSGGGYTLLQLLVEEVSGQSFNDYMADAVFDPLGMTRSTYILNDDAENVAAFYDENGELATHYRFASLAAASLYTTAEDMTRFIQAHLPGPNGAAPGRDVLAPETLELMRTPHASELGADIWGLGVMLFAPNGSGNFIVGHDGSNEPAINTAARFDPQSGDGFVLLETGNKLLATELAGDWVFWRTGMVDFLAVTAEFDAALTRAVQVAGAVFVISLLLLWVLSRRKWSASEI